MPTFALHISVALFVISTGVAFSGPAKAIEEPSFKVVAEQDGIEFRRYRSYAVAETSIAGEPEREKAASIGFKRLFDYIRGENQAKADIEMTAPVQQQASSAKIEMTAPVQQIESPTGWTIAFVLPEQFDASNAPRPVNPDITIRDVPGELVAVLRFSGRWTDSNISQHKAELADRLSDAGIRTDSEIKIAFYNAPFSFPWFRRNEVMVEISSLPPSSG